MSGSQVQQTRELRQTLIPNSSGYVGTLPQSLSPSSHDRASLANYNRHCDRADIRQSNDFPQASASHFIAFHGLQPRTLLLSTGFGLALCSFPWASAWYFTAFCGLRPYTLSCWLRPFIHHFIIFTSQSCHYLMTEDFRPKLGTLFKIRKPEAIERHKVMNYGREAGSTKKAEESNQKNRHTTNPENSRDWHCGTIHRRITGASEDNRYGTLKIPLGTKMTNGSSERISEAYC
ncbi:hypothetical protein CRG98_035777 [Punica granatum]|uniref:Uncharacterized protein n=1 Tax=Punica granatum TaxID=22663 RepID=A0A2I0IKE7_PUNGR|nr:hypothetical protein CRG98_035777 [Punica granatum]